MEQSQVDRDSLTFDYWLDVSLFLDISKELLQSAINMTVLKYFSLDSPLELHKDSIDCLKNKVIDMAWLMALVVNKQKAQNRFHTEQNELFRLIGIKSRLVLHLKDIDKDFLFDLYRALMVLEEAQQFRKNFIQKD